jgi:glucose/arabinose dehydrogenase
VQTKFSVTGRPAGITTARDGNIWVAADDVILRITP